MSGRSLTRRRWCQGVLAAGAGVWLGACASRPAARNAGWRRHAATLAGLGRASLPDGMRVARGFGAVRFDGEGAAPRLTWNPVAGDFVSGGRLRIAIAVDLREERRVEARLARTGTLLGAFDIRFAYALQPFELPLDAAQVRAALREGVHLHADAGALPLWIYDETNRGDAASFAPHLLIEGEGTERRAAFLEQTMSLVSLQPFGWLEGCVLDGLRDLARAGHVSAEPALKRHLDHFLDADGGLIFEDLRNRPSDNRFPGIESTLPVAAIAARDPAHPVVGLALDFWASRRREGGIVCDGTTATAEGAYTIGYPLATIAVQTGRKDLAHWALRQIVARIELLPSGRDLYLRCPLSGEGRTFRNWARAYAWYMLGLVRTWSVLHDSPFRDLPEMTRLRDEARRIADEAGRRRQPDGLWSCFLDRPETGIDSSGSAGIAAALAQGANVGLLGTEARDWAVVADRSLDGYLRPDGLLGGVAQHNAGGEALQSGGYRVLSQMGMGLLAQLHVATRTPA